MALQFKSHMIDQIRAGRKDETMRLAHENDRIFLWDASPITKPLLAIEMMNWHNGMRVRSINRASGVLRYGIGQEHAIVPGRGKASIGRLQLLDIRVMQLGQVTDPQAKREGFLDWNDFFTYWKMLYGAFNPAQWVYSLKFKALRIDAQCGSGTTMLMVDGDVGR